MIFIVSSASKPATSSENTYNKPPRARTSSILDLSFSNSSLLGATTTTGISASINANGPCFSSPAA
ncbi:Uncharacterised protein [Vibrio cholerae]|nr:Uncharacterised protein [Vibrio cholerae]